MNYGGIDHHGQYSHIIPLFPNIKMFRRPNKLACIIHKFRVDEEIPTYFFSMSWFKILNPFLLSGLREIDFL